jgi:hypothetical protein
VRALCEVVATLNNDSTRLARKKLSDAITAASAAHKLSMPAERAVGLEEPILSSSALVRCLYQPGELEGRWRRATDLLWLLIIYTIRNVIRQRGQPALYYLDSAAPARGFVCEKLLNVPPETELLPTGFSVGAEPYNPVDLEGHS